MSKITDSLKKVGIHIGIILGVIVLLTFVFLKVFLPSYTNHGETVSVPDLTGFDYIEIEDFLSTRDLKYEINIDSGFNADLKPLTVLKQTPKPGNKVKSGRKIYLTLNSKNAPLLKMPNLVNSPLKNVQEILANMGLVRGEIKYVPDIGINVVLEQRFRGRNIPEGFEIPKGSQIDLVVGDGLGNQILDVPNLLGMDEVDAEFLIIGSGLRMGSIYYVTTDTVPQGTIVQHLPPAGAEVKTGEPIDLWIAAVKKEMNF